MSGECIKWGFEPFWQLQMIQTLRSIFNDLAHWGLGII